ncbi:MAG: hypothetical protein B0W54_23870 [Cellvibrio sp. 79]|nr:MAG: hypothetical protein B0W54_23870 [Cellvibrio sp. 79]
MKTFVRRGGIGRTFSPGINPAKIFLGASLVTAQLLIGVSAVAQSGERGANAPYTRYEADIATLSNAQILQTTNFDISQTASEASDQKFVNLPSQGSAVEWTANKPGDGVTLRFTLPDSADGKGLNGEVDVYVNGQLDQTVQISSRWAWQYFVNKEPENHPLPFASTDYIAMRFDETHFILNNKLKAGDKIRIQKKNSDVAYGIDFIEIEEVAPIIQKPAGYVSITDFGGVPNDAGSDLTAFNSAVAAAGVAGTGVYLPPGRWNFDNKVVLTTSNIGIRGAGMWHTNVYYSNPAQFSGGILARVNNVEVSDIYFNTINTQRMCRDMACPIGGPYMIYKAFMGTWGNNSKFTRVWAEHFEVGAWLGGYDAPYPVEVTRNLVISHSRFRNNYADGINFSQGTSDSIVEHTNIRNSGDDGLAMWPSNSPAVPEEVNNIFRYNTVEHVFRAGGVAIFGGRDHQVHNLLIRNCFGGSAIRFTTDFPGYTFSQQGLYRIHDIDIHNCGTSYDLWKQKRGAIEFFAPMGARNMQFDNIYIRNSQRHGIQLMGNDFQNITFNDVVIDGVGGDAFKRDVFANSYGGVGVYGEVNSGKATFNRIAFNGMEDQDSVNQNTNFQLIINKVPFVPGSSSSSVTSVPSSASSASVQSSAIISSSRLSSSSSSSSLNSISSSRSATSSSITSSISNGNGLTIKNRWQNTYLCDGGEFVNYSASAFGPACFWVREDAGNGSIELRNVGTGDYMHIENLTGRIQATARNSGWDSSKWLLENVDGVYSRIKNRWQPAQFIHVENQNGSAQHGTIDTSWLSAQWEISGSSNPVSSISSANSVSSVAPAEGFELVNRWKDTFLCDTGDVATYSSTSNGNNCRWISENVTGGFIEIRNLGTGDYLHIENLTGRIQSTARNSGWDSSKWQLENVDSGYSRIKNRWQPSLFIHVENQNGSAQYGIVDPSWWSAQWKLQTSGVVISSSKSSSPISSKSSSVLSSSSAITSSSSVSSSIVSSSSLPSSSSSKSSTSSIPGSSSSSSTGGKKRGMDMPWTEYQAEDGTTNATVLQPSRKKWDANFIQAEAIGRKAVRLNKTGDWVAIKAIKEANSVVVRFSIPDAPNGGGIDKTLGLYIDGQRVKTLNLTSRYSWSYKGGLIGDPIVDKPAEDPHTFFDEVAVLLDQQIRVGAEIKLQRDAQDDAAFYVIDLIDLEQVAPPLQMPAGFTSVETFGIIPNDGKDHAEDIARAMKSTSKLWFPPGEYLALKITPPSVGMDNPGTEVRGAGMWHTTIRGPKSIFFCVGANTRCVYGDFSIRGESKARAEETEGVQKAFAGPLGRNSLLENLWIEHVVGAIWVGNDPPHQTAPTENLTIRNVRIRNTYADGVNLDNGTSNSVVENSHFRNTGDDAAVVWSIRWTHWVRDKTVQMGPNYIKPEAVNAPDQGIGHGNIFRKLTVQMPWRANCYAAYGGYNNVFEDLVCEDVLTYPGILIDNEFSSYPFGEELTIFRNISLIRAGGPMFLENTATPWKHGALKFYMREGSVNDILVEDVDIVEPLYSGIEFRGFGRQFVPPGERFSEAILNGSEAAQFENITLRNINIIDAGTWGIEVLDNGGRGQVNFENVKVEGSTLGPVLKGNAPDSFFNKVGNGNTGW